MCNVSGVITLMLSNCRLNKHGTSSLKYPHLYRSIVESLQSVSLTRPNITFSANKACQFMAFHQSLTWQHLRGSCNMLVVPSHMSSFSLQLFCHKNSPYMRIVIATGPIIRMTVVPPLDLAFSLVLISCLRALRNNILWLDQSLKSNIVFFPILPLNCSCWNHLPMSLKYHYYIPLFCVIISMQSYYLIIQYFMLTQSILNLIFILFVSMLSLRGWSFNTCQAP